MPEPLAPGLQAPSFILPAAGSGRQFSSCDFQGKRLLILFLPARIEAGLLEVLSKYQENQGAFTEFGTSLVAIIADGSEEGSRLVEQAGLGFPVLLDADQNTAVRFGLGGAEGRLPAVFLLDEQGRVHATYDAERYPALPNSLAVLRAVRRMDSAPRPALVSADDWILGSLQAPVILLEYSDYQCPNCIALHHVLERVLPNFEGKVALVHRHLPLRASHPLAQQAAEAAEAAGAQGKFWEMHHLLFAANCAVEFDRLLEYAARIGLDVPRFRRALEERTFQAAVNADFSQAVEHFIKLPPTLFANGLLVEAPVTKESLTDRINSLLGPP